jgi:NAD+ synthase
MPDRDSNEDHKEDALNLAKELGIETRLIEISPYVEHLGAYELFFPNRLPLSGKMKENLVKKAYKLYEARTGETPFSASILGLKGKPLAAYLRKSNAYYRIKHRVRMMLLYLYGELENRLVVGAANRTEYEIGFFVKHGCDDAADVMPLLSLYKIQVRALARHLDIPSTIIDKPPSPDLIPGLVDEQVIGVPYEKLDLILSAIKDGRQDFEISKALAIEETEVAHVRSLVQKSGHMRETYAPDSAD